MHIASACVFDDCLQKEMRILMVGLDAAGKTTILYKLKLGEVVTVRTNTTNTTTHRAAHQRFAVRALRLCDGLDTMG